MPAVKQHGISQVVLPDEPLRGVLSHAIAHEVQSHPQSRLCLVSTLERLQQKRHALHRTHVAQKEKVHPIMWLQHRFRAIGGELRYGSQTVARNPVKALEVAFERGRFHCDAVGSRIELATHTPKMFHDGCTLLTEHGLHRLRPQITAVKQIGHTPILLQHARWVAHHRGAQLIGQADIEIAQCEHLTVGGFPERVVVHRAPEHTSASPHLERADDPDAIALLSTVATATVLRQHVSLGLGEPDIGQAAQHCHVMAVRCKTLTYIGDLELFRPISLAYYKNTHPIALLHRLKQRRASSG